ncbi:MAG: hypothetical protein R3B57_05875 [Phycisphaerales bacterium]
MTPRTLLRGAATAIVALAASHASADTYTVELDGIAFVYNGQTNMDIDLEIQVGDTVRWDWVSGFHNVTSGFPDDPNPGALFFSGDPTSNPDTVFEFTFTDPGLYGYHCEVHENLGMVSSVRVVPAPGAPSAFAGLALLGARRRRR